MTIMVHVSAFEQGNKVTFDQNGIRHVDTLLVFQFTPGGKGLSLRV